MKVTAANDVTSIIRNEAAITGDTDMMLIDGSKFKLANEEFTFREK